MKSENKIEQLLCWCVFLYHPIFFMSFDPYFLKSWWYDPQKKMNSQKSIYCCCSHTHTHYLRTSFHFIHLLDPYISIIFGRLVIKCVSKSLDLHNKAITFLQKNVFKTSDSNFRTCYFIHRKCSRHVQRIIASVELHCHHLIMSHDFGMMHNKKRNMV